MHGVEEASSRLCTLKDCACGQVRANMWHGIFDCDGARATWRVVERWWVRSGGRSSVSNPIHKLTVIDEGRSQEVEVEV